MASQKVKNESTYSERHNFYRLWSPVTPALKVGGRLIYFDGDDCELRIVIVVKFRAYLRQQNRLEALYEGHVPAAAENVKDTETDYIIRARKTADVSVTAGENLSGGLPENYAVVAQREDTEKVAENRAALRSYQETLYGKVISSKYKSVMKRNIHNTRR